MNAAKTDQKFAICVRNEECEDLELRKVCQVLPDKRAARDGYIRVVDESGEDYLPVPRRFLSCRPVDPDRSPSAIDLLSESATIRV